MKFFIGQKCRFADPELKGYEITLKILSYRGNKEDGTAKITGRGEYENHRVDLLPNRALSIIPLKTYRIIL